MLNAIRMPSRVYLAYLALFFAALSATYGEPTCANDELPCDSGECILRSEWCDEVENCEDGSDEGYCETKRFYSGKDPNNCKNTHFLCKNGKCVPKEAACDTYNDCGDDSDEADCDISEEDEAVSEESSSSEQVEEATTTTVNPFGEDSLVFNEVVPLHVPALKGHRSAVERGMQWLISVRHSNYGWGEDTARALIALGLTEPRYFKSESEDVNLMKKQLQVIIAVDMLKNRTQPVSLSRLTLYINALLATCQDPSNFHGMDLVAKLRESVNAVYLFRQKSDVSVNPVVHLTLCVVNQSNYNDAHKLMHLLRVHNKGVRWQDMKSLAIMAMSCIIENYDFARSLVQSFHESVAHLRQSMSADGSFGNIYSTALAVQALLSVRDAHWDANKSINYLSSFQKADGSFGDLLATYFILPTLSGQNLVRLKSMPCFESVKLVNGLVPLDVLLDSQGPRHYVRYSLLYGHPVELSYSILLHVPVGTTFFDIMRLAQYTDPKFTFQHEEANDQIVVFSIGNVPNDAEQGIYWQLFARLNGRHSELNDLNREIGSNLRPYSKGVASLIPKDRDHIAFWYRR